jgi:hypothetical protein
MKSCNYCKQSDLDDDARKCPHCGEWQTRRFVRPLRLVAEGIGWLFLAVFIVGLASCAVMASPG